MVVSLGEGPIMNKKFLLQFAVCIFAGMTLLAGCSSQDEANLEADIAAIIDFENQYRSSQNAGDLDRFMSMWTEDGILMPPNRPAVIGKDQIRVRSIGLFDQFTFEPGRFSRGSRSSGRLGVYSRYLHNNRDTQGRGAASLYRR